MPSADPEGNQILRSILVMRGGGYESAFKSLGYDPKPGDLTEGKVKPRNGWRPEEILCTCVLLTFG